ncbi:MAG: hypothetical protein AAB624_02640 [Patescibacteria group bacterium]
MVRNKTPLIRYSICISGAAAGKTVVSGQELAERLGKAIAEAGHIVTTGATVGLPYFAAAGAIKEGGMSIGFSPASSIREHLRKYRLPVDAFDFINYTGMNYVGRDLYLVQSSDAVITVGGRFGSLHEFTSALEAGKTCGILVGSSGAASVIPQLVDALDPSVASRVIYDENPEELVKKIINILNKEHMDLYKELKSGHWYLNNKKNRG